MMNRHIVLFLFLFIVVFVYACNREEGLITLENDVATWSINPNEYHHYMSVVAISSVRADTNDILGAFSGNTLHGYTRGEMHEGRVIHLLLIYSNRTDINIGFRLYQSGRDRVIGSNDSLEFRSGAGMGTADNPVEIQF